MSRLFAPRVAQARDAVEHQIAAADGVLAPVGHEKAVAFELVAVFGLGFGARLLLPLFRRPLTWRLLDAAIGVVMWLIAWGLLRYGLALW